MSDPGLWSWGWKQWNASALLSVLCSRCECPLLKEHRGWLWGPGVLTRHCARGRASISEPGARGQLVPLGGDQREFSLTDRELGAGGGRGHLPCVGGGSQLVAGGRVPSSLVPSVWWGGSVSVRREDKSAYEFRYSRLLLFLLNFSRFSEVNVSSFVSSPWNCFQRLNFLKTVSVTFTGAPVCSITYSVMEKVPHLWQSLAFRGSQFLFSMPCTCYMEKEMATHSSILAWRTPWTEELGRLHSMGSQELDTT